MSNAKRDEALSLISASAAPATVPLTPYELELFAYHVSCLFRDTGNFGLSCREGVHVRVNITPGRMTEGTGDSVWDACTMDGHSVGNRCGAAKAYARLAAGDPKWWRAE